MIVRETTTINNRNFIRTYSDEGYMIERDKIRYTEAIDPAEYADERIYTETTEIADGEASETDYLEALARLGVSE